MQTVIDNKIWVVYLLTGDLKIQRLIRLINRKAVTVLMSQDVLDNLVSLLKKRKIKDLLEEKTAQEFVLFLTGRSKFVKPKSKIKEKSSLKDEIYINLAVDGKASYIVTSEMERFEKADGFKGINVIELENFLENAEE